MSARRRVEPAEVPCLAVVRGWGLALAALLLVVQALALIHLATGVHRIELRTGRIVHGLGGQPQGDIPPADPTPRDRHERCVVYTALTQFATTVSPVSPLPLVLPSSTGLALPPTRPIHAWRRELHRLSPAHSPPTT